MSNIQNIKKKFKKNFFTVGIIGLGYVGLPLANRFIKKDINVIGLDNDITKIEKLRKGKSYINSSSLKNFNYFKYNKNNLSHNYDILINCNVIIICLPTPLKKKKPDMSYLYNCAKKLKKIIKPYQVIILESTVFPGATREFFNKINVKKYILGKDLFLGYSPERENPGDKNFSYDKTPKVISGYTKNCLNIVNLIYSHIVNKVIRAKSLEAAETSKLLENLYRAVNIGLVNELKIICDKLKIDVFEVINLASTKNFGFQKFTPGPGLGGHCIPIDPFYLSWVSNKYGYDPKFIRLAGKLNSSMPHWVVNKLLKNLKITTPKILILGISYKKNVDDDRESPAFEIMKILEKKGISFEYNDPYFKEIRMGRNINLKKRSVKLTKSNIENFSATLLVTDHDDYDYRFIHKYSKKIFDTRGVYKKYNFKDVTYC
jgi:UDP-N-acetyl-D-glucosamine dehydrogenase